MSAEQLNGIYLITYGTVDDPLLDSAASFCFQSRTSACVGSIWGPGLIDRIRDRLAKALDAQVSHKALRTHDGVALGSSLGLVRKRNEDSCLVIRGAYAYAKRENFTAAIMCDGLGGMSHGREASVLAASAFAAFLYCSEYPSWEERVANAISYANMELYRSLYGNGGTTLSAVIVPENSNAILCHVGDSRVYALSPERVLDQLSRDDTMNALLNKNDDHPTVVNDSRLLQFVGMGDEMEAQIAPVPTHTKSILLTTDGAHNVPGSVLQRIASAAAGGNDLVRKLLTLSEMLGGQDNASVILLPLSAESWQTSASAEDELLVILPSETLYICVPNFEMVNIIDQTRSNPVASTTLRDPPLSSPSRDESSGQRASAQQASMGKTRTRKSKGRRSRAKVGPDARLPLDVPRPEVDIEFSSPANEEGRGKE